MKRLLLLPVILFIIISSRSSAQDLYAIDSIQQIEISFLQSNWDYILDTAKQGSDSYTMALWVKINGVQYDSAGVKYKGNSSFNPMNAKNPIHIELDHFKEQDHYGIKDIKLSNGFHEPSSVREVLLYKIARQYMPSSSANYAEVTINDTLHGLYTNVEAVTKTFLDNRFYSDNNAFVFGDNGGCNLVYKGPDTTMYFTPYTMKSDYGWSDLAHLCDTLRNNISDIEQILDVDRTIWMLAFTNVTVTLDSYIGQSAHNYYIYRDHNKRFNPILWDLNGGIGIFNKSGMGPALTTTQMQMMSPMLHSADSLWPLVKNVLAVPLYKRMYIAHMKTILNENFADSSYYTDAQYLQSLIDPAIISDPNAFYTHAEFLTNLTTSVTDGPKIIPGITELMEARVSFLNSTPEFMQVAPIINLVQASDTMPLLNASIFITATVTGATSVYIGTRASVMDRFTRTLMFDDGLHGDGGAGDNVYGIDLLVDATSMHYYIYADNPNAGMFSPARAEYEYHTINTLKGAVINELMPDNQSVQTDPYGEYNDWIELYNNSSSSVDLSGYYLSDNASLPAKWEFPAGSIINGNSYLIVWADDDAAQTIGLHANFKLSASGETILLSNTTMQVVDEITFPAIAPDMTFGRYPNGIGNFSLLAPTYNGINSPPVSIAEEEALKFIIYPNPATDALTILLEGKENGKLMIYNVMGEMVYAATISEQLTVDVSGLPSGMYFAKVEQSTKKFLIIR